VVEETDQINVFGKLVVHKRCYSLSEAELIGDHHIYRAHGKLKARKQEVHTIAGKRECIAVTVSREPSQAKTSQFKKSVLGSGPADTCCRKLSRAAPPKSDIMNSII
jgi:hypothetical protein